MVVILALPSSLHDFIYPLGVRIQVLGPLDKTRRHRRQTRNKNNRLQSLVYLSVWYRNNRTSLRTSVEQSAIQLAKTLTGLNSYIFLCKHLVSEHVLCLDHRCV